MTITEDQLKELIEQEVKGLSTKINSHDVTNCIASARRETGWTLPVTGDYKEHWLKERAKRHLFFFLWTESAHKFKFESINLQNRFQHYKELIKYMDEQFAAELEANPAEFAGVEAFETFGSKLDAGFAYDSVGRDITYLDTNKTIIAPSDSD